MSDIETQPVFCIFSFNRAQFLDNCVRSITDCIPGARIIVFDDDSDDAETRRVLDRIREHHEVVLPEAHGEHKHGGLYWNMQAAFESLEDEALVCFLQDDCQVVRPVLKEEFEILYQTLKNHPDLGFIHPCFIRGIDQKKCPVHDANSKDGVTYFREDWGQSAGVHYSDLFLTLPGRLRAHNWRFFTSEPENDRQARDAFGRMAYMRSPFAMWLPEVPAYRGKRKTLALRLAERSQQCGFYPFDVWSRQETVNFINRPDDSRPPVAEECLECRERTPRRPWSYNPLRGKRFLKLLHSIEQAIR